MQNLKNVDIRIFDINGKLILSQKKYNSKESISISKFKKGIYLLEITKNNKRSLKKFIKQ
ncbi:hypothetical protein GCM10011416_18540 [Polaribacter pacificus]|uniref:Secretion system C-terminal sorting domain-containing protein n=1 Tax=Polaribacter pacificus TaxID=1775173 RepID=A0A917HZU0_9FLAO|nr:hypothetical protein GCM10011416_18540 [Polaribacter pacificus]